MPADEVTRGTDVESFRVRTGPRHAAPKKPLFTRFHMPAGKAIALAAMPTAVLMGMGFTPTLALADGNDTAKPTSNSLTADEYKDCVAALEDAEKDPSASASPSATDGAEDGEDGKPEPETSASGESGESGEDSGKGEGADEAAGGTSSSDSGSDDEAGPAPSPSASQESPSKEPQSREEPGADAAEPSPSPSESEGGLLGGLGDAIEGIFTGGDKAEETPSPTPTPSASASAGEDVADPAKGAAGTAEDAVKDTADAASKTAEDAGEPVDEAAGKAEEAAEGAKDAKGAKDAEEEAEEATGEATASPSPSPSASESAGTDPEDCPVATDAEGGVDNTVPLPDDPWYLNASSLLLKGASYKGVVEVKTADGTTKKVLKYVISGGTDIGDLHQTVKDEQSGKTYHVQAAEGSTSTIRDGDTVMYTESISGNLLGLIPITFDPEHPPPLDIPLIYFTKVTVVQAGQFGGTLHIPGLHQYTT
ncbi:MULTISPECIES: ICP22 family protein [Streptomyces]|uniref:Membrane-bound hydrophilic protein n=1 Tax=Streptomyces rochei TaxID=1928 RepID=A0ABW7E1T5_STRRO|nr:MULTISPECIES: hypothetical protein [Streptomyces]WMI57214.1 hypothetical protein RBH85_10780 [Streptomyces rochei]